MCTPCGGGKGRDVSPTTGTEEVSAEDSDRLSVLGGQSGGQVLVLGSGVIVTSNTKVRYLPVSRKACQCGLCEHWLSQQIKEQV